MKTKNLTQWSNLYSNELSFKLKIYSSILPRILVIAVIYLLTVTVASILIFEFNSFFAQFLFVAAIMLIIVVISLYRSQFSKRREQPCYFLKEVTLLPKGVVEIDDNQYQMHLNSRIGLLGCWLCLAQKEGSKVKIKTLFIFRSSISQYHYSQLCRVIKRNTSDHSITQ